MDLPVHVNEVLEIWSHAEGDHKINIEDQIFKRGPREYTTEYPYYALKHSNDVTDKLQEDFCMAYGMVSDFRGRYVLTRSKLQAPDPYVKSITEVPVVVRAAWANHIANDKDGNVEYELLDRINIDRFPNTVKCLLEFNWNGRMSFPIETFTDACIRLIPVLHAVTLDDRKRNIFISSRRGINSDELEEVFLECKMRAKEYVKKQEDIDQWFKKVCRNE